MTLYGGKKVASAKAQMPSALTEPVPLGGGGPEKRVAPAFPPVIPSRLEKAKLDINMTCKKQHPPGVDLFVPRKMDLLFWVGVLSFFPG